MASYAAWKIQRGILWSAELGGLNNRKIEARLPAEYCQIEKGSLAALLSSVEQMDPIAPDAIARRFDGGRQCFTAQVNGDIAAYGWITHGPEYVSEFDRQLQVEEGEAYVWDCSTLPVYRQKRLFITLLAYISERLRGEGVQRLWIIGLNGAQAINRGVAAAGFKPVMRLAFIRLSGMNVLMLNPHKNASTQQRRDARRLLRGEGELAIGPLLVGKPKLGKPPDTHSDR